MKCVSFFVCFSSRNEQWHNFQSFPYAFLNHATRNGKFEPCFKIILSFFQGYKNDMENIFGNKTNYYVTMCFVYFTCVTQPPFYDEKYQISASSGCQK